MEKNYKIGKVIGVTGDSVNVELLDHKINGEEYSGVPENMSISVSHSGEKITLLIGQPGTFISVSIPNGSLLSIVADIQMKEGKITASENKEAAT